VRVLRMLLLLPLFKVRVLVDISEFQILNLIRFVGQDMEKKGPNRGFLGASKQALLFVFEFF
jgi:hypothetical protein